MDVKITKFDVEQNIKNNGIQIDVYEPNGGERRGDLTVTKAKLIWCSGKTHKKNGVEVTWNDFILTKSHSRWKWFKIHAIVSVRFWLCQLTRESRVDSLMAS